ncbi:hypothetical protein D3C80_1891680 [compost metagenome]
MFRSADRRVQIVMEPLRGARSRRTAVKQRHHLLEFLRPAGFIVWRITRMTPAKHAVHVRIGKTLVQAHRWRITQQYQQPDAQLPFARK